MNRFVKQNQFGETSTAEFMQHGSAIAARILYTSLFTVVSSTSSLSVVRRSKPGFYCCDAFASHLARCPQNLILFGLGSTQNKTRPLQFRDYDDADNTSVQDNHPELLIHHGHK